MCHVHRGGHLGPAHDIGARLAGFASSWGWISALGRLPSLFDPSPFSALTGGPSRLGALSKGLRSIGQSSFLVHSPVFQFQSPLSGIGPLIAEAVEAWEKLPEAARKAQEAAAKRGWLIGLWEQSVAESVELSQLAERKDPEEFELALEALVRDELDVARLGLISAFPHRADVLEQAFDAHARGHYGVSIPVMLAQAEGIHLEMLEERLFRRGRHDKLKKRVRDMLGEDGYEVASTFLRPLFLDNALSRQSDPRTAPSTAGREGLPLSRHEVLHGTDASYGTERNGLRALSHLEFLWWARVNEFEPRESV